MGKVTQRRILTIEDNPDHRFIITELLYGASASQSYIIDEAFTLKTGLLCSRDSDYDAILLDLTLPDSPAEATFVAIPEIARKAPLIVLTNYNSREMAERALQLGAQKYLLKEDLIGNSLLQAIEGAIVRFGQRRALQEEALVDELTGLLNRRGFLKQIEPQWAEECLTPGGLLIAFLDVDSLKQINDQLGHDAGSRVLQDVAGILRSCSRGTGIVARWGADEYVVCIQDRSRDAEKTFSQDLNQHLLRYNDPSQGHPYQLAISVGFARCSPKAKPDIDDLIRKAEGEMYKNKRIRKMISERQQPDANEI